MPRKPHDGAATGLGDYDQILILKSALTAELSQSKRRHNLQFQSHPGLQNSFLCGVESKRFVDVEPYSVPARPKRH